MRNSLWLFNPPPAFQKSSFKYGKAITTSQAIASYFGKLHKDVLKKIESLECSSKFTSANFCTHVEIIRAGAVNRDSKYYEMTKDGFVFLVMGFTGKKAAQLKEAYIDAFNQQVKELQKQALPAPETERLHPAHIPFIDPLDDITLTFNRNEITVSVKSAPYVAN